MRGGLIYTSSTLLITQCRQRKAEEDTKKDQQRILGKGRQKMSFSLGFGGR